MLVYDVQGVSKTYSGQRLPATKDISLQIAQGEIFGLLGDNGAGKSTLVRQMVSLLRPDAGTIHLFGGLVGGDSMLVPRCVGYMPQESAALNVLSVEEALHRPPAGVDPASRATRVRRPARALAPRAVAPQAHPEPLER